MGLVRTHPPHCTTMTFELASLYKSMNSFRFWTNSTKYQNIWPTWLSCLSPVLCRTWWGFQQQPRAHLPVVSELLFSGPWFNKSSSKLAKERITFTCSQCREHDRSGRCSGQMQCREQGRSRLRMSLPTSSKAKFHDNSSKQYVCRGKLRVMKWGKGLPNIRLEVLSSSLIMYEDWGESGSLPMMFDLANISRQFQVYFYLPPSSHLWVFIHLHLPSTSTRGLIRANGNHWTENTSLREWLPDKGRKHTCAVLTMRDSMKCRNKVA